METEQQTTLRDTLSDAYDKAVETEVIKAPEEVKPEEVPVEAKPAETDAQKAERLRDDKGRFVEGKPAPEVEKPPVQAPVPETQIQRPNRPSSWKKDHWDAWDKLDPKVAEYILQREGEYAKGVSTYKGEYDRAKPIMDAIAPHLPDYERMGIDPAQQLSRYAEIHKTLAMGSPQQKLATFMQVAQQYNVPVEQMFMQGQDGKIYFNPQIQQAAMQSQPQQATPNVDQIVESKLAQREAAHETRNFREAKGTDGNLLHPHFETVRETMAQLLDAKLVDDIPSAYEAALKMPQHSDLYEQAQKQRQASDDAEKARQQKEIADRAKRNAVSTKSATPASVQANGAKKDRRSVLEDAYETHVVGRV